MHLDIFNQDAFSLSQLTLAMNEFPPHVPGRISELGLFSEEGIATLNVSIESIGTEIALVQTSARGTPGKPVGNDKRKMRSFQVAHLERRGSVLADEVQGLRAFGSETETETLQNLMNRKLMKIRRDLDVTKEWQRMGAVKGIVLDADGSTLLDLFTDFGVAQIVMDWNLDNSATSVKQKCVDLERSIESVLGGVFFKNVRVLCSSTFFDALTSHDSVIEAYTRWNDGAFMRETQRKGFLFCGVWFEEYRGKIGATDFIAAGEAYAIPEGIPDQFITYYGPADYMETVNTIGLPYYAKQWAMEGGKGVHIEAQSNPLHLNTRPRAVHKLTLT